MLIVYNLDDDYSYNESEDKNENSDLLNDDNSASNSPIEENSSEKREMNSKSFHNLKNDTKNIAAIEGLEAHKMSVKIPQNKLGINPGKMSVSDKNEIVYFYGTPDGMKE